jgi:hypothetical protein
MMEEHDYTNVPFPNITESVWRRWNVGQWHDATELLRKINQLQATTNDNDSSNNNNNNNNNNSKNNLREVISFVMALLSRSMLYQRTSCKKYGQICIVLFTDAQHQVVVDSKQLLVVLDSLRAEPLNVNCKSLVMVRMHLPW